MFFRPGIRNLHWSRILPGPAGLNDILIGMKNKNCVASEFGGRKKIAVWEQSLFDYPKTLFPAWNEVESRWL